MNKWFSKWRSIPACVLAFCALAPLSAQAGYYLMKDHRYIDGVLNTWHARESVWLYSGCKPVTVNAESIEGKAVTEWRVYYQDKSTLYKTFAGSSSIEVSYDSKCDETLWYLMPCYSTFAYTLIIKSDGSTISTTENVTYPTSVTLPKPTKTGNTLGGWTATGGGSTKSIAAAATSVTGADVGVTADGQTITLDAKWNANTYKVTVAPGEGGTGGGTTSYTYNDNSLQTVAITLPTRENYYIGSWTISISESKCSTKPTIKDSTLTIPAGTYGNITATPNWVENSYTLKIKSDNTILSSTNVTYSASVELPALAKDGFTLSGWTASGGGSTKSIAATATSVTGEDLGVTENGQTITLTAQWKVNTYTVTIAPGEGGTGGGSTKYTYNSSSSQTVTITPPTRANHYIGSWTISGCSTTPSISGTTLTIPAGTYGNITATPNWVENSYTLTIKSDGSIISSTKNVAYSTRVTLPALTKDGKTLSGWTANGGESTKIIAATATSVSGEDLGVTANGQTITLEAQWNANTYSVIIAPGEGGTGGGSNNYTYSSSLWQWKFTPPTYTGYHIDKANWRFEGWNKSQPSISDSTISVYANTYGNITATPTWVANTATVTYENCTTGKYHPEKMTYDTPMEVSKPSGGGAFTGWEVTVGLDANTAMYSVDGGTTWHNLTSKMSVGAGYDTILFKNLTTTDDGDVTLWANWDDMRDIAVVADPEEGGTVAGAGSYANGSTIELVATANAGYSFEKWADGPTENPRSLTVTNDATYTACFKGKQYKVTFEVNDDENYKRTVTYGQAFGNVLPTPKEQVGKVFEGWFDDEGSGEQITPSSIVRVTEDKYSFYSHWVIAPPNYIAFDGNGATNETPMAVQMFTNGVAQALNANTYAKPGVAFAGWGTNAVSDVVYTNQQEIALSLPENATNTLWAVWTNNLYAIKFAPGTYGTGEEQTLYKTNGVPLTLPGAIFTCGGYTQTGWSYKADGSTKDCELNGDYETDEPATFYPYWSASPYKVIISAGYEGGEVTTNTYSTSAFDKTYAIPQIRSRSGYTLSTDWQVDVRGVTGNAPEVRYDSDQWPYVFIPAGTYGDFTVTAQWVGGSYTIIVESDGTAAATKTTYQVAETNQNVYFTLPTKAGKSISSWFVGAGWTGTQPVVTNNHVTIVANTYGDFEIYPLTWTNNVYTVTIAPGEGGTGGATINYEYTKGLSQREFELPTHAGCHIEKWSFDGWNGTMPIIIGTKITVGNDCYGNITATPIWVQDERPVPGEADRRDISAMAFTDGALKITFTNADERFDYLLRGTNTLENAPRPWPTLWTTNGTGTIVIEPPKTSESQMFYYLETSQRK